MIHHITFSIWLMLVCCHLSAQEYTSISLENSLKFLFRDELSYTLIGEKPISLNDCQHPYFLSHEKEKEEAFYFLRNLFLEKKNFILRIISYEDILNEVQLIHKHALVQLISQEPELNTFIEKKFTSIENLFHALENPEIELNEIFDNDPKFIGMAFGYGADNSEFFMRIVNLGFYLKKRPYVCLFSSHPHPFLIIPHLIHNCIYRDIEPEKSSQFASLKEEWRYLKKILNSPLREKKFPPPIFFQLPFYISRTSEESDRIRKKYIAARDTIAQLFLGKKFSTALQEIIQQQETILAK